MRQCLNSAFVGYFFVIVNIEFSFGSKFTQKIYETIEARQVSTYSKVIRDVSQLECVIACSDSTCVTAGFNLNTRVCYVSNDDASLATSTADNHWIVLTKHDVLPGHAETGDAVTGIEDCGLPFVIESGRTQTTSTGVSYTCTEGFTLIGNNTASCNDGVWSNVGQTPVCAQGCAVPGIGYGEVFLLSESSLHGSEISFLCHEGYWLLPDTTSTCNDGKWIPEPPTSCNAIFVDCLPPIDPPHGSGSYDGLKYGSKVTYVCDTTFTLVGNDTAICLQGVWNTSTPNCAAMCSTPISPKYGGAYGTTTYHGDVLTYHCDQDFVLVGKDTITCDDGSWSGVLPTCIRDCGQTINYPHADVIYADDTTEGNRAVLTCHTGYQMRFETPVMMICETVVDSTNYIIGGEWKTTTFEPECWELMFRGTADNGDDAVSAYLVGGGLTTTTEPDCMLVQNNSCTHHYRNPKLDSWEALGVRKVRYEMYNSGEAVFSLIVNGSGSTYTDWLYYNNQPSSWKGLEWPWVEVSPNYNSWWALNPFEYRYGYSFKMVSYGLCSLDYQFTMVLFQPNDCYSNAYDTWPKFLYALNNHGAIFSDEEYGLASVMAVWVYHD